MLSDLHGLRIIIRKTHAVHYDMFDTHSYLDSIQFFSHGYTEYLFIHYEASGRANPVIIGPLFFYPTVKPSTLYHAASTHYQVS